MAKFSDLVGQTIWRIKGLEKDSQEVVFLMHSGDTYVMNHTQDWCESVNVVDVIGDPVSILMTPILLAEEVTQVDEDSYESGTWTFYKLSTIWANVTIRWLGESNGYYSESVDFGKGEKWK